MAIELKSPRDIDQVRRAGALLWRILDEVLSQAAAGARTLDLSALIAARIAEAGAHPVMQDAGFPAPASITINEEVVHAPPGPRTLRPADVITIDSALRLDGWCADAASVQVVAGRHHADHGRLAAAARQVLDAAIAAIAPGRRWSAVVDAAVGAARAQGCSLVREYAGHGIGRDLHEPPAAAFPADWDRSHWTEPWSPDGGPQLLQLHAGGRPRPMDADFVLRPGMVLTVEPIVVLGPRPDVLGLDDGWTVATTTRAPAAHEERTVAITRQGALVLTAP